MKSWAQIGRDFGGTTADKNVSNNIKRAFSKWLLPYEKAFFPEEAMPSSQERSSFSASSASFSPRKRDRFRSCPMTVNTTEKKLRSSYHPQQYEEDSFKQESNISENSIPFIEPRCSANFPPCNSLIALPSNRSYVTVPYSTSQKFFILLLPSKAEEELSTGALFGAPVCLDPSMSGQTTSVNETRLDRGEGIFSNDSRTMQDLKCDHRPPPPPMTQLQFQEILKQKMQQVKGLEINNEECSQEAEFPAAMKSAAPGMNFRSPFNQNGLVSKDLINDLSISSEIRDHHHSTSQSTGLCQPSVRVGESISGFLYLLGSHVELKKEGEMDREDGSRNPFKSA